MKKGVKVALILIGSGLLIGGGVMFAIGIKDHKFIAETREVDLSDKDIKNFEFDLATSELTFIRTTDSTKKVVFHENEKEYHEDKVVEHTLYVTSKETKKWYEWMTPDWSKKKVEVYLPAGELGTLKIKSSTGDIKIPHEFTFESADFDVSTGDVNYKANTSGDVKISISTGDISISDISAKGIELHHSTGKVNLKNVNVTECIVIDGSTGKTKLESTRSACLNIKSSTGDVSLNDVETTGELKVHGSTSDIEFDGIDGNGIDMETSTGDIKGSVKTGKVFKAYSSGRVIVPDDTSGAATFKAKTSTGDIKITLK